MSDLSSRKSYLYKAEKGHTFSTIYNFIFLIPEVKKGKKKHQETFQYATVYISITVLTLAYINLFFLHLEHEVSCERGLQFFGS